MVRREWMLRPGMPFTQEDWNDAKRDAVRRLASWRYAAARLAASRAAWSRKPIARVLEVTLESGPPFLFGALEVSGTKRYAESVVTNLSPVRPGGTYDRAVLDLYTRRLLETGYFAGGRAELVSRPGARGRRAGARHGRRGQLAALRRRPLVQHRCRAAPGAFAPQRRPVRLPPGAGARTCASISSPRKRAMSSIPRRAPRPPGGRASSAPSTTSSRKRRTPSSRPELSYNLAGRGGGPTVVPGLGAFGGAAHQRRAARRPLRGLLRRALRISRHR